MSSLKERITQGAANDLAAIEKALAENLNPHVELVREVAGHIIFSGGKRLRPLLAVLCARLNGRDDAPVYKLSTVFEYLHAATLLHDDLVDSGKTRRGKPAAHLVYGPETAVLTGDFLFARTCSLATDTGMLEIIRAITFVVEAMSQGEILQLGNRGRAGLSRQQYLETIYKKTAVLIEAACKVGALFAGAGQDKVNALARFGVKIGMAFQMTDDLLDITADPAVSGKALYADLAEGKMTLPLIIALERMEAGDAARTEEIISRKSATQADFAWISGRIRDLGGLADTHDQAAGLIDEAKAILESGFEPGPERELLADIARYAVARDR
jgi:octaprenyl-diphosphate synthase